MSKVPNVTDLNIDVTYVFVDKEIRVKSVSSRGVVQ